MENTGYVVEYSFLIPGTSIIPDTNIDVIAISDHNTVDGTGEVIEKTRNTDILAIPSIEISSSKGHILGFGCEENIPRVCTDPLRPYCFLLSSCRIPLRKNCRPCSQKNIFVFFFRPCV